MSIKTTISIGEFLDKLTILEIKRSKINDTVKLVNIVKEHDMLAKQWKESKHSRDDISSELEALRQINERLWETEEKIRNKEKEREFDANFIELARSIYFFNDERARIKKNLNTFFKSELIEEKSY